MPIAFVAAWLLLLTPAGLALHPQDGPHTDLRIVVGERSVRWNIGMNLAFADELVGVRRESIDVLASVEEDILRDALVEHLTSENRVVINGQTVTPVLREWSDGRADAELLPLFPRTGWRALTRFVCVLEYPAPDGVDTLEITWKGYPEDVIAPEIEPQLAGVRMAIEAQLQAQGRVEILTFLEAKPTLTWQPGETDAFAALEPVPEPASPTALVAVASWYYLPGMIGAGVLLLAGSVACLRRRGRLGSGAIVVALSSAALLQRDAAIELRPTTDQPDVHTINRIAQPLIRNIYEAFTHTDESLIYDLLERSAHGDVLDRLYRDIYRAMVVSDHDQGRAIISGVEVGAITSLGSDDGRFTCMASWEATGSVYHWGHSHQRTYAYTAELTIEVIESAWRITELQVTDQERLGDPDPAAPFEIPEGFEL